MGDEHCGGADGVGVVGEAVVADDAGGFAEIAVLRRFTRDPSHLALTPTAELLLERLQVTLPLAVLAMGIALGPLALRWSSKRTMDT